MATTNVHRLILAGVVALLCSSQGGAQTVTVSTDPANHPRLFLGGESLAQLKQSITDGTPKWMYDKLIERCEALLTETDLDAGRWAKVTGQKPSWNNARDILDLSLAYMIGGKTEYRALAIAEIMKVCQWPTWYIGYEPNRAVLLQGVAITYDWLYDDLGEDRAQAVAAKIAFECEQMSKFLTGAGRNSIGQSSSMAPRTYAPFGVAAIAIKGEYPKADEWINLARESVPVWVDGALDDDGAFYYSSESCYNTLALNYVLGFYIAYRDLTGENLCDTPEMRKNVLFQLYKLEPQRDGQGQFCVYTRLGAGCPQNMVGFAALLDDGLARWYYEYVHGPHGLSAQYNVFSAEDHVMQLLWWKDVPIEFPDASPRLGRATLCRGSGKSVLRTGFESVEDIHFAMECGPPKEGHSQADVGNFILNAYGERFIEDPGTTGSYAWGMSPGAHNLVFIDDVSQAVSGQGTIDAFIHTDFADYLLANQKPAYDAQAPVERAQRHVLFVRPSYFVVVDDVNKDEAPHRYDLLLHTDKQRELLAADTPGQFTMRGQNADLLIAFASPQDVEVARPTPESVEKWMGNVPSSRLRGADHKQFMAGLKEAENLPPFFIFRAPQRRTEGLFFTLLYPTRHDESVPKMVRADRGDLVTMTLNDRDIVGYNRGDQTVTAGGCATDAKLFHARAVGGKLVHYIAANATRFQHLDVGFSATERVTVAFKGTDAKVLAPKAASLTLRYPGIKAIQVDGKPVALSKEDAGQVTVELEAGEHEVGILAG